jgi:hypothetical protein
VKLKQDSLLRLYTELAQVVSNLIHDVGQLTVRYLAALVQDGGPVRAGGLRVSINEKFSSIHEAIRW